MIHITFCTFLQGPSWELCQVFGLSRFDGCSEHWSKDKSSTSNKCQYLKTWELKKQLLLESNIIKKIYLNAYILFSFLHLLNSSPIHVHSKWLKKLGGICLYLSCICVDISTGIITTVCLWCCRNRGAQINPQDTHSTLHFRMADKQQHLVTFWCSYWGFNPLLRAAPCCWLQQTWAQWVPVLRWDFFCRTPAQKKKRKKDEEK